MKHIWNAIKSIFVNDAHEIVSKRGKEILAEQQKEYTFVPNPKTSRTQSDMVDHVLTYSTIWLLPSCFLLGITKPNETTEWYVYSSILFFLITFCCHFITDYITSRIVSRKFANKEYGSPIPNIGAFTVIGFDQVLHYIQLFGTFYLLTK